MDKRIKWLCESLPHFATMFRQNEGRGQGVWQIIRWKDITPDRVTPEQVQVMEETYTSKTNALQASAKAARQIALRGFGRTEKDHPGVWKWVENGTVHYQSVIPKMSESSSSENGVAETEKSSPANTMVRIGEEVHRLLRGFASEDGKTLQAVLENAVREYDRQRYFAKADAAYEALRNDPAAWNKELEERKVWDVTLKDNQDAQEVWHEDGNVTESSVRERKIA